MNRLLPISLCMLVCSCFPSPFYDGCENREETCRAVLLAMMGQANLTDAQKEDIGLLLLTCKCRRK